MSIISFERAETNHDKNGLRQNNSPMHVQAAQTLFVIYKRDSIALRFEPFQRIMKMVRK